MFILAIKRLRTSIETALNRIILYRARVKCEKWPRCDGDLMIIRNSGTIKIARDVRFVNSTRINMAGVNKPCSIAVGVNGSLFIGKNSGFSGCSIVCEDLIVIGDYCTIGANVSIYDNDFHALPYLDRRLGDPSKIKHSRIKIGNDVFIGANSILLKGTHIGDRTIIGAGSVVTGFIPKDQVWGGNPAHFIRNLKC